MLIELATSHFGSVSQNIPEILLHNLYIADNPLSVTKTSYVTRPISQPLVTLNGASFRGIYYQQGFNNDKIVVVVDDSLYTMNDDGTTVFLGFLQGDGICQFASTIYGIAILSGKFIYIYDQTSLILVETPDALEATSVASLNNYFIFSFKNSNKFYWIRPGEVVIDALDFASAEANADNIVSVSTTSDELWLIGATTTEVWQASAVADAPFYRISGRIFNQGCAAVASVVNGVYNSLPALLWISDKREVIVAQGSPNRISNDFVEEVLRKSTTYYSWFFRKHRNDFYVISTDLMTLVYDLTHSAWYRWSSFGKDFWAISTGVQKDTKIVGGALLGKPDLVILEEGVSSENQDLLVCEVTGTLLHNNRIPLACTSVEVISNTGFGSSYISDPVIELRWSDDQGGNWSAYSQASLGTRGETGHSIVFRSLGLVKTPGRRFELRFSVSESFRLDYVTMNGAM